MEKSGCAAAVRSPAGERGDKQVYLRDTIFIFTRVNFFWILCPGPVLHRVLPRGPAMAEWGDARMALPIEAVVLVPGRKRRAGHVRRGKSRERIAGGKAHKVRAWKRGPGPGGRYRVSLPPP